MPCVEQIEDGEAAYGPVGGVDGDHAIVIRAGEFDEVAVVAGGAGGGGIRPGLADRHVLVPVAVDEDRANPGGQEADRRGQVV